MYECRSIFKNLKTLRMTQVKTGSIFDLISCCSELETLEINFVTLEEELILPKITFPKLVKICFKWSNQKLHPDLFYPALCRFLELNSHIKILKIQHDHEMLMNAIYKLEKLNEFYIRSISHLPIVVETFDSYNMRDVNLNLSISEFYFDSISMISRLRNITSVVLRPHQMSDDTFILLLQNLPNVKMIEISIYKHDELDAISESKTTIITTILQYANQLSKLTFSSRFNRRPFSQYPINEENYYEILRIVQNRPNHIKLTIEFIIGGSFRRNKNIQRSQSKRIFDMIPDSLTIVQQTSFQ